MRRLYNTHSVCQWGYSLLAARREGAAAPLSFPDISSLYRRTSNPSLRRLAFVICCVLPARLMAARTSRSGPNTGAAMHATPTSPSLTSQQ